jgi:nucleoside-diphosphate-sugar epimerase
MTLTVGITGGTGFLGKYIIRSLIKKNINIISLQRSLKKNEATSTRYFDLSDPSTLNEKLLRGIDVIIHTAALVHDKLAEESKHLSLNITATSKLFNLSKTVGVRKFIFISTVGVYGLNSSPSIISRYTEINPLTPYAKAKSSSEKELLGDKSSRIVVSVFRLPLVILKNAPGNYGLLDKISKTRLPLPFGLTDNKRSVISGTVAAQVIAKAAQDLDTFNGLHLICESIPVSTKELVVNLRKANLMPSNLLPVPKIIMKLLLYALRKKNIYEKLYEDLVFTSSINVEKYLNKKKG